MNLIKDIWTKKDYDDYIKYLISLKEDSYAVFHRKLVATGYEILGIRIPIIRDIVKKISKGNIESFLQLSNSIYYEEVLIEGLIIEVTKDFEKLDAYLPKIDNWAICDAFSLKWLKKDLNKHLPKILSYLKSDEEFIVRFGLIMLLGNYVQEEYMEMLCESLDDLKLDKYYVNMAAAWLLCEMYVKEQKACERYLLVSKVNKFTFNKAISKIRDSFRVSQEKKDYLNTLKRR